MWSLAGDQNINKNSMSTKKVSSDSPSKSPNTCSSPSTLSSPSPIPNQLMIGNSMEEVWNDINLASLHEHPSNYTVTNTSTSTNDHVLHGMTFQDLLATSSNKDTPTRVASKEPSSGGGNNFLKNSLRPSPATMLNLNYGYDHFQYVESRTVPLRSNPPKCIVMPVLALLSFYTSLDSPSDSLGSSSLNSLQFAEKGLKKTATFLAAIGGMSA
ncbi:hypothetical protein SADUNF_Sadunf02G0015200 [Salix dunnii]|uniref:Uncharacterized protein n=1 Tax=Salix dunnii TaxID=1413687 RepID=A0A835THD9_9ROSI|nr:hypothetical protein SADUNF_Sadunf02G0015200 [Salix dunnii]